MTHPRGILFTSAGRRVSLIRSFQEAISNLHKNFATYAIDIRPELSSACQVADNFFTCPRATSDQYIPFLLELVEKYRIQMVIPTIDTELEILSKNKEKFLSLDCHVIVPDTEFCKATFLKSDTEALFKKHGLQTPSIITDLTKSTYPLFAKRDDSSRSVGAMKVETYEEAMALLETHENYVFQPFIDGPEYTIDVYISKEHMPIAIIPRKRLEVRDGEVNKAIAVKHPALIEAVKNFCKEIQVSGVLTIQVIESANNFYFIEINSRFGGGYPLSVHAGCNFGQWLIEEYIDNQSLKYFDGWRENTLMLRYDHEIIRYDACL